MDHSLDGLCNMYIEQSNKDDAAWYTCTAFNAAGRTACRAKVQVIGKYILTLRPRVMTL